MKKKLKNVPINKFTFGIESENYVKDWPVDHGECHETRSPKMPTFNGVLIYYRNIVKRHMDDEEFVLHSFPISTYGDSVSAHIHFKANVDNWSEYSWELYDRLYNFIELFQFFFKNSPNKNNKTLSERHYSAHWCEIIKMNKQQFSRCGREYNALTPNAGIGTLEFRYNEVPKHLNQLSMFYYIIYLASQTDIKVPKLPNNMKIHKLEDIEEPINSLFSFKDKKSIANYKKSYKSILLTFAEDVDKKVKKKFYCFNSKKYLSFGDFVKTTLESDLKLFNDFFKDNNKNDIEWGYDLKKNFDCKIPVQLIK